MDLFMSASMAERCCLMTTVRGVGLGDVGDNTGHTGEVTLVALEVGGHSVGQHNNLGGEEGLGVLERVAGGNL